jgi:lipopolysaccharide export system permease protein
MKTIGAMITRMVMIRFFAILIGISLFVLTLEVVSYSKEILALDNGAATSMVRYMLHRLPATLSTFLLMSFLLALLLTLTELSYRNEVIAIWASGISPVRLAGMLLPLSITVGILHFVLMDRAIPWAAPTLRQWAIADYGEKRLKIGERDPIWMRSGKDVVRAGKANADSTLLEDVYVFKRDSNGILEEQIMARSAKLTGTSWSLANVVVFKQGGIQPEHLQTLTYEGAVRPAEAGFRSGDPEEMSLGDLSYFVKNEGFGIRPTYVYETWWHKRLVPFIMAAIMTALCVPLASRFRRGGGLGIRFAAGVGLGFLYFILDGMMVSAGELGFVAPALAAWFPTVTFGLLAFLFVLRSERA